MIWYIIFSYFLVIMAMITFVKTSPTLINLNNIDDFTIALFISAFLLSPLTITVVMFIGVVYLISTGLAKLINKFVK